MSKRKVEGRYDYDGMCKPVNGKPHWKEQETFSVSIFQWVKKSNGGLKKSKSVYRIHGRVEDAEAVYKRAEEVCTELDQGISIAPLKSETAR